MFVEHKIANNNFKLCKCEIPMHFDSGFTPGQGLLEPKLSTLYHESYSGAVRNCIAALMNYNG